MQPEPHFSSRLSQICQNISQYKIITHIKRSNKMFTLRETNMIFDIKTHVCLHIGIIGHTHNSNYTGLI